MPPAAPKMATLNPAAPPFARHLACLKQEFSSIYQHTIHRAHPTTSVVINLISNVHQNLYTIQILTVDSILNLFNSCYSVIYELTPDKAILAIKKIGVNYSSYELLIILWVERYFYFDIEKHSS